jgi:hypothetical protein
MIWTHFNNEQRENPKGFKFETRRKPKRGQDGNSGLGRFSFRRKETEEDIWDDRETERLNCYMIHIKVEMEKEGENITLFLIKYFILKGNHLIVG